MATTKSPPVSILKHLPKRHFDNVIRWIKRVGIDHIPALLAASKANLERLEVKRNLGKAVAGIPDGSDQGDIQSVITWMSKIHPGSPSPTPGKPGVPRDKKAIRQLVAIDATAVARMGG